jgi:hypothetical protein
MIPTLEYHFGGQGIVELERLLVLIEDHKSNGCGRGIDNEFQMRCMRRVKDRATVGAGAIDLVEVLERLRAGIGGRVIMVLVVMVRIIVIMRSGVLVWKAGGRHQSMH